jgi:phytanoyl-CoA hydroxylase
MMTAMPPSTPAVHDLPPPPLDEDDLLDVQDPAERAAALPLDTRFRLRAEITPIQRAFLDRHGYLVFDRVASEDEVATILRDMDAAQARLLAEGTQKVFGVPVWFGTDPDGAPILQRLGFSSTFSEFLSAFVKHARFEPVRRLIGDDARIGEREKDGVVFNRYINTEQSLYPGLGWHTDSLRDVFYNFKMPGPMLNVGLHFDRIREEDGGLRVLPGTHRQSALASIFRKIHFVTQAPDPDEVMVETWPGDLTVHDGRMWHRVQRSPHVGWRSLRRSMYVPYVIDTFNPKSPDAKTPLYQRLFDRIQKIKKAWLRWRAGRSPQ